MADLTGKAFLTIGAAASGGAGVAAATGPGIVMGTAVGAVLGTLGASARIVSELTKYEHCEY